MTGAMRETVQAERGAAVGAADASAADASAADASAADTSVADDARSIDGVIAALYEAISGPAGAPRDWARFERLFMPGALLVPVTPRAGDERTVVTFDPRSYARDRAPIFERDGFLEYEIARREQRYGALAHVWSAYEARLGPDEPVLLRGANSLQLVHDRGRWWVVSAIWERESALHPLPPELLGDGGGARG